jgi:hypothetical protein
MVFLGDVGGVSCEKLRIILGEGMYGVLLGGACCGRWFGVMAGGSEGRGVYALDSLGIRCPASRGCLGGFGF